MSSVQLVIIAIVVVLILVTISYYLYQEAKFKSLVENNFNQAVDDVITKEDKTFILDGIDGSKIQNSIGSILQKDTHTNIVQTDVIHEDTEIHTADLQPNVLNEPKFDLLFTSNSVVTDDPGSVNNQDITDNQINAHPEDSVEAFFAHIYQVPFPFLAEIDTDLDFIVDIGFEEITKIKILPEVSQFTTKPFRFYILDKSNEWRALVKGTKYNARALKLVVQLIDSDGIISQAQVSNIYNELHKFVIQNNAHICKSDYESSIAKLQKKVKYLDETRLNLVLYLILKEDKSYNELKSFLNSAGLDENNGEFLLKDTAGRTIFTINDENGKAITHNQRYNLLQISTSLHKQLDANNAINHIFDYAEKFMEQFESRLLTTNKKVLTEKDYEAIQNHVRQYVINAKRNNIELGGALIQRLF